MARILSFAMITFAVISRLFSQNVNVSGALVGNGTYATLGAAFTAINGGAQTGSVIAIDVVGNTAEAGAAVLNSNDWASLTIQPSGGVARTITTSVVGHLVDLNGADNVTINGINASGNSLTISNTATGASSALRFIGDASNNNIQNCTILGSASAASNGVVIFGTGLVTGNDGNTINSCNISGIGTNFPINCIFSSGTSAIIDNNSNTLINNNISDFFNASTASTGININSFNSQWTISNNSIFQTSIKTYTSANTHNAILVNSGLSYIISDNFIGGSASGATGSFYTMTSTIATRFIAINLGLATGNPASSVQGNLITSIQLNTSSGAATTNGILCGINITNGNVEVGTISGNTIGGASGVDLLRAIPTTANGMVVGIHTSSAAPSLINISNNTIGGLSSSGVTAAVSGNITGILASVIPGTLIINNNLVGNISTDNMRGGTVGLTTGSSVVSGIHLLGTPSLTIATTATVTNNTVQNLRSVGANTSGAVRGIWTALSSSSLATGWSISNNTVTNLITNATTVGLASGTCSALGIHHLSSQGCTISNNTVSNISNINTTATTNVIVAGIVSANAAVTTTLGTSISRNKIWGLSNTTIGTTALTPPVVAGIAVRSGNNITLINNNMISLGSGQVSNTSFIGIWNNNGSTPNPSSINVYNNSIVIEGTAASGSLPSFSYLRSQYIVVNSNTVTVDVKNNIFVNNRSGGSGMHFAISNGYNSTTVSATGWSTNASNFNLLNGNAATIGHWTSALNFTNWKIASVSDENTISGYPVTFNDFAFGDLHLNMGLTPTPIESGGTNIVGMNTDIDNQTRPGPTGSTNGGGLYFYDIGADEFDGVILDVSSPVINYSQLPFTCNTGDRLLENVVITDLIGVPVTGANVPRIYYSKKPSGMPQGPWFSSPGTLTSGDGINGNWKFNIIAGDMGGLLLNDTVFYYVIAEDLVTPLSNISSKPSGVVATNVNSVTTPPSSPNLYFIGENLIGSYTVGAGQDFTSMIAAGEAFNKGCINGSIEFLLSDPVYNESDVIVFGSNHTSSSINKLTIRPASGVNAIINVGVGLTFYFEGTDYVTIDGSNNNTNSNNLEINQTLVANGTATIYIASTGINQGCTNFTIKNCTIRDGSKGTGSAAVTPIVSFAIYIASSTTFDGWDNDNITIENNVIKRAAYGIQAIGKIDGFMDNLIVRNNVFGDEMDDANSLGRVGMWYGFMNNGLISGNQILNVNVSDLGGATGLLLNAGIQNSIIENNKINTVKYTGTGIYASRGIDAFISNTNSNVSLINNFISDIKGIGSTTLTSEANVGLRLSGTLGNVKIYNNSINLGSGSISGNAAGSTAAALYIGTGASNLDIRNNILTTNLDNNASTTDKAYSIYSAASNSVFSTINYNNYSVSGPAGILGFLTSDRATLSDIQTGFGQNLNSVNVLPVYTSSTDLHLPEMSNVSLANLGTYLPAVTSDIDLDARSNISPDMGADEFGIPCSSVVSSNNDAGIGSLRMALECVPTNNTISIDAAVTAIDLTSSLIMPNKTLTIIDNAMPAAMIKLNSDVSNISLPATSNMTINSINIKDLSATKTNPVLINAGNLDLINVKISGDTGSTTSPKYQNNGTGSIDGNCEIRNE